MPSPPWWLSTVVVILLLGGTFGFVMAVSDSGFRWPHLLQHVANLSLVLTLAAVSFYVYYTYLLAREAATPSASFVLKPYPQDKYHFAFIIQNHSKFSLQCWCRLNATVYGQPVSLEKFYAGQTPFDVQPFGLVNGHFSLHDLLAKAGRSIEDVKRVVDESGIKEPLYLDIEFWYNPVGSGRRTENPKQPHYFDFQRDVMVTDF